MTCAFKGIASAVPNRIANRVEIKPGARIGIARGDGAFRHDASFAKAAGQRFPFATQSKSSLAHQINPLNHTVAEIDRNPAWPVDFRCRTAVNDLLTSRDHREGL